ncbi:hypothetical protein ZOSMA_96G00540 [Zostera marina]|uniref:Ubiquitin-like protease family profile domain-containing protein n=1 Tax=Zostera marina TaxID=29655 RepID=A0A0K9NIC8_ZOSMR|nr:hypothetical protein ZOSMA_96G00540 [Zostera marina]
MQGRLNLSWGELLPPGGKDVPPEELVITDKVGTCLLELEKEEERFPVEELSDHELKKQIDRCKSTLSNFNFKLPDKGAKLNRRARLLEKELDRRKKEWENKDDTSVVEIVMDSRLSLGGGHKGLPNYQTSASCFDHNGSFGSIFKKKLNTKADPLAAAFHVELGTMNNKRNSGLCASAPSRLLPFRSPHTIKNKKQKISDLSHYNTPLSCLSSQDRSSFIKDLRQAFSTSDSKYNTPRSCLSFQDRSSFIKDPKQVFSSSDSKLRDDEVTDLDSDECREVVLLDEEDMSLNEEDLQSTKTLPLDNNKQKEVTIYYPTRNHPECVEICYSDITCLDPRSYLSSTIMNFYIQYLQKPTFPIGRSKGEYHFFNTYFYSKLEEAVSSKIGKNARFAKLRRWLKGVNIFQKAYVFLPIHGKLHWSLVIICIPAKEEESGPVILHLDSLGVHDTKLIFENIERYLIEEWGQIEQDAFSLPNFPISECLLPRIVKKKIMVPQQTNEYDCGLFVLYFIERFIEDAPERVKLEDLDKFGAKWFRSEEASALRTRLRDLLMVEFENRIRHTDCAENAGLLFSCLDSIDKSSEVLESEKSPDIAITNDQVYMIED